VTPSLLAALVISAAPACAYDVVAGPGARELRIEARFAGFAGGALAIDDGFEGFVGELEREEGGAWKPFTLDGDGHGAAPPPAGGPLHVRYRFLLAEAARSVHRIYTAFEQEGAFLAPPSTWLVRPASHPGGGRYRLRVTTPPGLEFVTGLLRAGDGDGYEASFDSLGEAPYSGFGRFRRFETPVGGARLELAVAPGVLGLGDDALRSWLEASGRAVSGYFGRFPVPRVLVIVIPGGRRAIGYGTTLTGGGASIMLWIGPQAKQADLDQDWVLVHEMSHLGFPTLPREHRWLEEGLATYVEPLARVAAGTLDAGEAWKGLLEGLPRGLPRGEDGGLDGSSSIGRVYWGGALFWFLADLEIRERTESRLGLPDALRGILAAGGDAMARWEARDALARGDAAVGLAVLTRLFDRMATKPVPVDLPATFARLGVSLRRGQVVYDDARPLASIRRSLTAFAAVTPRP